MKIFIDIGHPAHVHYFRHFISIMEDKGHTFFISARDKEVIHMLLQRYDISFYDRGRGADSMTGKLFYLFQADAKLFKKALKFKPDLFLSFASPYAAHAARLTGTPHIVLDDTESAGLNHLLYLPFSTVALNPKSFGKKLGEKQIFFDSFMELAYLHPNYFSPNPGIYQLLGLKQDEKYAIIRFISWNANHDVGQKGLAFETKMELVKRLSEHMNIFISSEGVLPEELEPFRIHIPPEKLHDVLAFAQLYIGEGATTASECAMLGTPAIYINSLSAGTLEEQHRLGLLYNYRNSDMLFATLDQILSKPKHKQGFTYIRNDMLKKKINPTAFLTWFVENFPESFKTMNENPGYQYRFR